MTPAKKQSLRRAVRYFYDLQKLRIQSGNRAGPQGEGAEAELDDGDQAFLERQSVGIKELEKSSLKEVSRLLKGEPIFERWLSEQRGCGPTMSGVILAEFNIENCHTVSKMWAYAGLGVDTRSGKAPRRKRGEKGNWNPFLRTKLVGVLGPCMLKANSPWRKFYDDYKHRKASAGWGESDGHRHNAAIRYMVKMFLLELWKIWRTMEDMPTPDTYAEAKLGIAHGDHAGQLSRDAQSNFASQVSTETQNT